MNFRNLCLIAASMTVAVAMTSCTTTGTSGSRSLFSGKKTTASETYIAALQGGIVGRSGVEISDSDQQRALEAEYRALEAAPGGQPVVWSGRGVSGQVVASAPYQVGSQNCRQYSHTVTASGKDTNVRGAACRNPDGTWSLLN